MSSVGHRGGFICRLVLNFIQARRKQFVSTDAVYDGLFTGCALAGPSGCVVAANASGNPPTPLDVNAVIQSLFETAHDATRKDPTVPITSGELRGALVPPPTCIVNP